LARIFTKFVGQAVYFMQLTDFHFDLPNELIARYPTEKRSDSRLMCLAKHGDTLLHKRFHEVVEFIQPGDLMVFNNTKVIPARLFGHKMTGGLVELLVERVLDSSRMIAQVRVSKPPRVGDYLLFQNDIQLEIMGRKQQFYELRYRHTDKTILSVIERQESREYWVSEIEKFKASGLSRKHYCKENQLNYFRFGYWIKRLRKKSDTPAHFIPVNIKTSETPRVNGILCTVESRGRVLSVYDALTLNLILEKLF
jgi:hypothetical protein